MQKLRTSRTVGLWLIVCGLAGLPSAAEAQRLGFEAATVGGGTVKVEAGKSWAIVFLGTGCPMAKSYVRPLNQLQADFATGGEQIGGVRVLGIMSNIQDSLEDIKQYASELDVDFSLVHDSTGKIAERYGARRTPEAFLLDSELKLRYHGRIDDQYAPGVARAQPDRRDLRIAIEQLLAGKPIEVRATNAVGCIIGRKRAASAPPVQGDESTVTYSNQIARILNRNCTECHRKGDIGPFSMQRFEDVAGWADTMLETIENGRMPPWHASNEYGSFSNARVMPEIDKELFRLWIEQGTPEGDPKDLPPRLPAATNDFVTLESVDRVFPMRERPFVVPANGVVEYQYFVVDPKFTEDRWVQAAEVVPGSRDVVHHAIVFVRPPDGEEFRGVGWLTAYVPGQRMQSLPSGYAQHIPAGSKFVFQMHYTPVGVEREDTSKLGLRFVDEASVTHETFTIAGLNQEFEIPPEAAAHTVTAEVRSMPKGAEMMSVTPHMHFRGKSFTLQSESEDGEATLLKVPSYDFNWQHTYRFQSPLPLDTVQRLSFDVTFDNSAQNPFNPDSQQWVTWGDQTWEEMAVAFFEVAIPRNSDRSFRYVGNEEGQSKISRDEQVEAYVRRVFESMDSNGDGVIYKSEAPIVVRWRGFSQFDRNGDGKATRVEIEAVALGLYR